MKSSDKGKGLTRRDMLGRTTVIAAAGVTGLAGGVELAEVAGGAKIIPSVSPSCTRIG
jgi:nitrous-oxide reductase